MLVYTTDRELACSGWNFSLAKLSPLLGLIWRDYSWPSALLWVPAEEELKSWTFLEARAFYPEEVGVEGQDLVPVTLSCLLSP